MKETIDVDSRIGFNVGSRHESIMKARVFVTQEQEKLNYSPAEDFGEVVFITRNEFSVMKASLRNESLIDEIAFRLKSFDADVDYITVSGSPVVAAVVFLVLGHRGIKCIKMLRWSNRDTVYHPITVQLGQKHI